MRLDKASGDATTTRYYTHGGLAVAMRTGGVLHGFVGGINDASTGLLHLGARDYDADLGRFVSLDPITRPADSQQTNGYNYANNSPVSLPSLAAWH
ncbi:RHS repeat-associated core domain-containing protein [Amycolatopsis sp. NPDC051071]|uniref:RHS repeat-associated core domain-containing protein n=1 Tax=Amycolatopsis sp. NPDC051071 TaxID=3154637 RepID=UPI003449E63F